MRSPLRLHVTKIITDWIGLYLVLLTLLILTDLPRWLRKEHKSWLTEEPFRMRHNQKRKAWGWHDIFCTNLCSFFYMLMKRIYLTIKQFSGGNDLYVVTTIITNHFIKTKGWHKPRTKINEHLLLRLYLVIYIFILIYLERTGPD